MLELKNTFLPSEGFFCAFGKFSSQDFFFFFLVGIKKGNNEERTGA